MDEKWGPVDDLLFDALAGQERPRNELARVVLARSADGDDLDVAGPYDHVAMSRPGVGLASVPVVLVFWSPRGLRIAATDPDVAQRPVLGRQGSQPRVE
jgi:hypothetical protein